LDIVEILFAISPAPEFRYELATKVGNVSSTEQILRFKAFSIWDEGKALL